METLKNHWAVGLSPLDFQALVVLVKQKPYREPETNEAKKDFRIYG
jgi:hypothetical protein